MTNLIEHAREVLQSVAGITDVHSADTAIEAMLTFRNAALDEAAGVVKGVSGSMFAMPSHWDGADTRDGLVKRILALKSSSQKVG